MCLFSVAINNYNYKRFVAEAIESAFAQTHPPLEVIVVDDGSTDGSADYIQELYGDRVRLIRSTNKGQLNAMRLGVEHAKGEFIAFLDSDDHWSPSHLQHAFELLQRRPDLDFITSNNVTFGLSDGILQHHASVNLDLGVSTLAVITGEWLGATTSCLIVRQSSLGFLSNMPPSTVKAWKTNGDDVIVLGCSVGGARKYQLAKPTVHYRIHGGNAFFNREHSKDVARFRKDRSRALLSWLKSDRFPGLTDAEIIRAELPKNSFRSRKHLRKLFKANLKSDSPLSLLLLNTAAILRRAIGPNKSANPKKLQLVISKFLA